MFNEISIMASLLKNTDKVSECNFHAGLFDVTYRVKMDVYQNSIPISFLLMVSSEGKPRFIKFLLKNSERMIEEIGQAIVDLNEKYGIQIKRLLVPSELNGVERFIPIANCARGAKENLAVKTAGMLKMKAYCIFWNMASKGKSYEELPNYPQLILEVYKDLCARHDIILFNDPLQLIDKVVDKQKEKTIIFKVSFESGRAEEFNVSPYTVNILIELRTDQTLDVLHHAIQDALGWMKDHCYCFFKPISLDITYTADIAYIGGGGVDFMWGLPIDVKKVVEARKTKLDSLKLDLNTKLIYLFDFGDENYFNIEVAGFGETSLWFTYPRLRSMTGSLKQYP